MEGLKELTDLELQGKFLAQKDSDYTFRERRHEAWNDIYMLYKGKPQLNRLTQRQSVHIPLTKYAILSAVKDMDKMPMLYFNNLSNDSQKEIFYNEHWNETKKGNKLDTKDAIDKKQCGLFGRSFKKLNIENGKVTISIVSPLHMLVDRFLDPANIDTAGNVIQTNMYKSLYDLERMDGINKTEFSKIKDYFQTKEGRLEAETNLMKMQAVNDRMAKLGLEDAYNPKVDETYVEINEAYMMLYSNIKQREIYHVCSFACITGGTYLLSRRQLCDVLGETRDNFWYDHLPFTTWAVDVENEDFWSDGIGDIVMSANKIVDAWMSQLVENRTLRNFGMNYYDATKKNFFPQTWTPTPGGYYGLPGKPSDVFQRVEIPDLSESLDEIQFVIGIAEKAIAINATQQGAVEKADVTLGEIQLSLANAKERIKDTTTSYRDSWMDLGMKYVKLLEGSFYALDPVTVNKKGRNGLKVYTRLINPEDWFDTNGYMVEVKTITDKQSEDVESIQKLQAAKAMMPGNPVLQEIIEQKTLEFCDLSVDQVTMVMEAQKALRVTAPTPQVDANGNPIPTNQMDQNTNLPVVQNSNVNQATPVTSIA